MSMKKIVYVYVDMDNVLVDFKTAIIVSSIRLRLNAIYVFIN